ncbi:hypothetical protein BFP76_01420 [Amylibacter kogurei]|uniref:Ferrochelatase n=1 Tax=Paramylibacter kogurei TaxID=1889778 RepID=A0A2G5K4J2_9RHOB|nr:hypothetical protein [Amylibacter kogurei]PIB23942.1 hypothetical protein BFP76_01420 [Amylibacter kogurei]
MNIMKIAAASIAAVSLATASMAGSLAEPEVEPMIEVVEEEPGSSAGSGGILLPLLGLAVVAALIASDDS